MDEQPKFVLTELDAYSFHLRHKHLPKMEEAEQLLTQTGLAFKAVDAMIELELVLFERAQLIARMRLIRLIERINKKKYCPTSDTFFDIHNFPTLVKEEDSQNLSQSSAASTQSWLEELEPSQGNPEFRKRKPFGELGSRT
jgi:hypothetical protein